MYLTYIQGNKLDFVVSEGQNQVSWYSKLSPIDNFISIDAKASTPDAFDGNLTLKNHVLG